MPERIQITYNYLPEHLETAFEFDSQIAVVMDEFPHSDYDGAGTWLASPPYNYRDMDFEWNDDVPEGLLEKLEALKIPEEVLNWEVVSFEVDDEGDELLEG